MCGRYNLEHPEQIGPHFRAALPDAVELKRRYNVAPTQVMPVVLQKDGQRRVELMQWGLVPAWSKEPNGFINAKSETVAEKPSFRRAFQQWRCVVPASSFIEWKAEESGKLPFVFRVNGEDVFALAGLYESWTAPDGTIIPAFTILTTEPNELMATVHHRMPVILNRGDADGWIDPTVADQDFLHSLLKPFPASRMEAYRVSTAVNNPRNNTPEVLAPLGRPPGRYVPDLA